MTVALEVSSVSKIYGSGSNAVRAVNEVSFSVETGQFVALVGPSGSGKTTMLAMLAGLLYPTDGSITIDGQDLSRMADTERTRFRRQRIGFTFQANNLLPYLTAQENVEIMLRLNNECRSACRQQSKELLTRLGLSHRLGNLPRQLSGGEQQRVAIARALIHNPALVLADEPTASLDTERAYQVVETFASMVRGHDRAGIMVTHDLRMCVYVDRIIEMQDGKIRRIVSDRQEINAVASAVRQVGGSPPSLQGG
jgi:hemin transport system ATP-binding protein